MPKPDCRIIRAAAEMKRMSDKKIIERPGMFPKDQVIRIGLSFSSFEKRRFSGD